MLTSIETFGNPFEHANKARAPPEDHTNGCIIITPQSTQITLTNSHIYSSTYTLFSFNIEKKSCILLNSYAIQGIKIWVQEFAHNPHANGLARVRPCT